MSHLDAILFSRQLLAAEEAKYLSVAIHSAFQWEGLPLTIPEDILNSYLIEGGQALVYEYDGDLFVTTTAPTTEPDVYGRPTVATIQHGPAASSVTITRTVGVDCVLITNLPGSLSLSTMLHRQGSIEAQIALTEMKILSDLRSPYLIQARDDESYDAALAYLDAQRDGHPAVVLAEELDDISGLIVHPTPPNSGPAHQVVELATHTRANFWSRLGVPTQANRKSQYVSDMETAMTEGGDILRTMLHCRQKAIAQVNALFDTDISVEVSPTWVGQGDSYEQATDQATDRLPDESATTAEDSDVPQEQPDAGGSVPSGDRADVGGSAPELELTEAEVVEAHEALTEEGDDDDEPDTEAGSSSAESDTD